jgi:trehalose 6-phosphate phosphatase
VRSAPRIALLIDFDGTLARIQPRPELAFLDVATRQALARLAQHPRVRIWIVSGRRLAVLRGLASVEGVKCLGLHGWEGGNHLPLTHARLRAIRHAKDLFQSMLAGIPGVWIEDKGPVFVVHYRQAGVLDVVKARRIVRRLMTELASHFRMLEGKKIWEILPVEISGKGEAARLILDRQPAGTLAIYLGDDATDEDAFRTLPRALTVRVGRAARTAARYRLKNPREVREFLQKIEQALA